jgi:hypothetical protein
MKPRQHKKRALKDLRAGLPALNNDHPAEWMIAIFGAGAANAAMLFDAEAIEEVGGPTIRFAEKTTDTPDNEL